jgi:hypothetical protein
MNFFSLNSLTITATEQPSPTGLLIVERMLLTHRGYRAVYIAKIFPVTSFIPSYFILIASHDPRNNFNYDLISYILKSKDLSSLFYSSIFITLF